MISKQLLTKTSGSSRIAVVMTVDFTASRRPSFNILGAETEWSFFQYGGETIGPTM